MFTEALPYITIISILVLLLSAIRTAKSDFASIVLIVVASIGFASTGQFMDAYETAEAEYSVTVSSLEAKSEYLESELNRTRVEYGKTFAQLQTLENSYYYRTKKWTTEQWYAVKSWWDDVQS